MTQRTPSSGMSCNAKTAIFQIKLLHKSSQVVTLLYEVMFRYIAHWRYELHFTLCYGALRLCVQCEHSVRDGAG